MIYIGIDVAKDKHDCFITNSDGEVLFKAFTITNNLDGFNELHQKIASVMDDVFGMYDEDRLASVLRWLHKENRQVIISTCHKREMEILDKEGIPYQKILLQV